MPQLIPPDVRVRESFLAAMAEFRAEGRGGADDPTMIGIEHQAWATRWGSPEGFAAYVAAVRAAEHTPPRPGWVTCTTLWWVDGSTYLGRLAIRHALTPALRDLGGHIGYDVRPSARRRGHATAMLRAALPVAARLGVDPALLTCEPGNIASRRVIERNGGVPADPSPDRLRFWVPTSTRVRDE
jgi:predicted acetyltransferase